MDWISVTCLGAIWDVEFDPDSNCYIHRLQSPKRILEREDGFCFESEWQSDKAPSGLSANKEV